MAGPLTGYRVLDLTSIVSGPLGTQLLGDQGADVIKVEPCGTGDLARAGGISSAGIASHFVVLNRSKRSLALNLSEARGKELLERLIPTADVFVQNFRPGVIERIGFGEPQVRALRPDIVYASISGFGDTGPLAGKRVYDPLVQAMSGMMYIQGGMDQPCSMNTIIPDKLTAMMNAQAITAALLERERSGKGQKISLSMLDTTIAWMWADSMLPDIWLHDQTTGKPPMERNNAFKTSDGHIAVCIVSDAEYQGFCRAADRPDLAKHPKLASANDRGSNAPELFRVLREVLVRDTTANWLERLNKEDVPAAPLLTLLESISHPQVIENQLVYEREHPHAGRLREVRPSAQFDRSSMEPGRHAPLLGEHSREVLDEVGVSDAEFEAFVADGIVQTP